MEHPAKETDSPQSIGAEDVIIEGGLLFIAKYQREGDNCSDDHSHQHNAVCRADH